MNLVWTLVLGYALLMTGLAAALAWLCWRTWQRLNAERLELKARLTAYIRERGQAEMAAFKQHQSALGHLWHANLLGELACQLAHEITQPLSAIVNYTQGCVRRLNQPEARPEALIWPLEQAARQAELAGEILQQFRQRLQRQPAELQRMDLNYISCQVAVLMETSLQAHPGVYLKLDLTGRLPAAWGDPLQVQQVEINLVRNSLQALATRPAGQPGIITLQTLRTPEGLQVRISDNGPGLPADLTAEQLFEAFFSTKTGGLGLGLTISRSLIKGLGGQLWAEPMPSGACFCFTLPLAPVE